MRELKAGDEYQGGFLSPGTRVLESTASGSDRILVEHLTYSCLADREVVLVRPSTGLVLCECGSAGWLA